MKRLLLAICICSLALTGCTPKEKTTVLEENVLLNEINYANKITKEKLDIKLEEGYQFEPGFFYEDKVYGIIKNQGDPDATIYRGYYSKSDGLVKEDEILAVEAYSDNSYKNRRVLATHLDFNTYTDFNTNSIKFRDNGTGEVKTFEVPFVEQSGIRVPASNNDVKPHIKELLNNNVTNGLNISIGNKNSTVIGDYNYGYTVNTIWTYEGEMPEPKYDKGKVLFLGVKSPYSTVVLYNYETNTTITYDGNLTLENFPYIQRIISADKNTLYAIAGTYENELYRIDIKDNKYSLALVYKFDLGDRCINSWNSRIIGDTLILESYVPIKSETEESYSTTDENILLFNLQTKEYTELNSSENITNRILNLYSSEYFLVANSDVKSMNGKILLCRINNNKIEYLYDFDVSPSYSAINEDNKKLFVASFTGKGNGELEYYLYNIDID